MRLGTILLATMLALTACGGSEGGTSTTAMPGAAEGSTTVAPGSGNGNQAPGTTQPAEPQEPGGEVVLEGGSATLTLDGEQIDFDFFVCFFGYEATQDDDVIFAGAGQATNSAGVPVQVLVQDYDSRDQDSIRDGLQSVTYFVQGDSGNFSFAWSLDVYQRQEDIQNREEIEIDGDRVTADGIFENADDETAPGTFSATCSPNSQR